MFRFPSVRPARAEKQAVSICPASMPVQRGRQTTCLSVQLQRPDSEFCDGRSIVCSGCATITRSRRPVRFGAGADSLVAWSGRMGRYAFRMEFHGADYAGWQRQDGQLSVQEVLETALARLEPVGPGATVAAGRTDSGVHAWGQVAHCDLSRDWEPRRLREALNAHLRDERVRVLDVAVVGGDFSARHSAVERTYVYRILSRRPAPTIEDGLVWHVRHDLDVEAMRQRCGTPRWKARFHHLPFGALPGRLAGQDTRFTRCGTSAAPERLRDRDHGKGAQLPSPPDPKRGRFT